MSLAKIDIDVKFVIIYESKNKKTTVVYVVSGVNTDSNLNLAIIMNL